MPPRSSTNHWNIAPTVVRMRREAVDAIWYWSLRHLVDELQRVRCMFWRSMLSMFNKETEGTLKDIRTEMTTVQNDMVN
jgi:hypothetical protein